MISVIIVQHDNAELTVQAIRTMRQHHRGGFEIIVVDNGSGSDARALLQKHSAGVHTIASPTNIGFGAANNLGAREAKGDILLFLNNDTLFTGPILAEAERAFSKDRSLGVLGPRLLNPDGTFQLSAGHLPSFWREIADKAISAGIRRRIPLLLSRLDRRFACRQTVGWVTGAALFIRKEDFLRLGLFDESMFMYFEDKDICQRAHASRLSVVYEPALSLVHIKGGSSPAAVKQVLAKVYRESQLSYYAKHRPVHEQVLLKAYLLLTRRYPSD